MKRWHGAGVFVRAHSTGRMLIGLRKPEEIWGTFGGGREKQDKTPLDTALREFVEETGYTGDLVIEGYRRLKPGTYTFFVVVPREFSAVSLDGEHYLFDWTWPESLRPSACHWILKKLL